VVVVVVVVVSDIKGDRNRKRGKMGPHSSD